MKTVFNYNTPVTAEWFNVVNGFRLRFDGDPLLPGDMVDGQYLPIRTEDLDPSVLIDYAQLLYTVSTTTDQNINGNKTFLNPVTIVPGVSNNHATTKAQLDAAITDLNTAITNANNARLALDAATVKLTTAQTIAGVKTFNSSPIVPPGSVPGAAVNFAQLAAMIITTTNNKVSFPGGLTITWGDVSSIDIPTGGGSKSVIFNHTYINIPYIFCAADADGYSSVNYNNVTRTGLNLSGFNSFQTSLASAARNWSWFAIGY